MSVIGLSVEGSMVGFAFEGFGVGLIETVGFKEREGLKVGPEAVGLTVGCFFPVGVRVEAKDGTGVGCIEGKGVGFGVGCAVGRTVG
jgi:hypothetical protein